MLQSVCNRKNRRTKKANRKIKYGLTSDFMRQKLDTTRKQVMPELEYIGCYVNNRMFHLVMTKLQFFLIG